MAFVDDLKLGIDRAIRIVKFDRPTIAQVADDPAAFQIGLAIVAIAGLAQGLGGIRSSVVGLILMPILFPIVALISTGIFYLVGMLVKPPTWDFMRLFRPVSHSYILNWVGVLSIIPFLGALIGLVVSIYQVCVLVVVVETVGQCDRTKALIIVLLPLVICCGLGAILMFFAGAAFLGALGLGALATAGN